MNRPKNWRKTRPSKKGNKKNRKWERFKNLLNILTNVVTIAASIATCITVFYMREERNQAYKPYFIFRPVYCVEEIEKPFYPIHDINNLLEAQSVDITELVPIEIELENIGSGTATNIDISFSCGKERDYMKEVCWYYGSYVIENTDDCLRLEYYSEYWGDTVQLEYTIDDIEWSINKPYIYTKESLSIEVPEEYRKLLYMLAYCTNGDYKSIPAIEVSISYNDLQGIDYHEKFLLKADVYVDLNTDEKVNYVEYVIEEYE